MIREALRYLVELGQSEIDTAIVKSDDGTEYWAGNRNVVGDFIPDIVDLSTLQGLVDFIHSEDLHDKQIFILSQNRVTLMDRPTEKTLRRHLLASVSCNSERFEFDKYLRPSCLIEGLQKHSSFADDSQAAEVLKVVGNLQSEAVHTDHNDGVSQKVVVSQGTRSAGYVNFKNPIKISFYDTFSDLGPGLPRTCNLKFKSSEGNVPLVGLFLTGDPEWVMSSRFRIRDWLSERCKNPIIV